MELIERIRAVLDEDERVARAVVAEDWHEAIDGGWNEFNETERIHISRWSSARVLRQVAAMRKIVEEHSPVKVMNNDGVRVIGYECRVCFDNHDGINNLSNMQDWPCPTILTLAEACGIEPEPGNGAQMPHAPARIDAERRKGQQ